MKIMKGALRRGPVVAAAVVAMAAATLPVRAAAAGDDPATARQTLTPITLDGVRPGKHEITLITGDKVTLTEIGGRYGFRVEPAARPGRPAPTSFRGLSGPDGFYVYPDDVLPAIQAGRIDRELFDVKYLAENGYADEQSAQTPVIAQYPVAEPAVRGAAEALPASTPTRALPSVHGAALAVPHDGTAAFWSAVQGQPDRNGAVTTLGAGLAKLWLDKKVAADLEQSVPLIGAPQAWSAGFDGTGVKVAILDTGVDETHPDLSGKIAETRSFVPDVPVRDGNGHGTHVASIITGSGAASGGKYKGVAPGVKLAIGKVLDDSGTGTWSGIIEGMQWAATSGAKVVSMSIGGEPTDGTDPVSQALDELSASTGTLFVVAAGNNGTAESVSTPGSAASALTVAATDKSDGLASFSSRGPRLDATIKPDIAAPGLSIVAARAAGTSLGTPVNDSYTNLSGTSMATPHVSGAAAILSQRHPGWKAPQLKAALMSTSKDVGLTVYERGAGRLDLATAIAQKVYASTASVDYGAVPDGGEPLGKQLAYTNLSDQPVTLTLTPALRTVGGEAVPQDALTVDKTLTVPAGGTATATVTLTSSGLGVATYTGAVTATDGHGVRLTTPVGLLREPPKVALTVNTLGRDGTPVDPGLISILDVTGDRGEVSGHIQHVAPGVNKVLVPRGVYSVTEWLNWIEPSTYVPNSAWLLDPEVTVTDDTEITLDARKLQEVTFSTPKPSAVTPGAGSYTLVQRILADGGIWGSYEMAATFYRFWVTPTKRVTKGEFLYTVSRALTAPEVTMEMRGRRPIALHPEVFPHDKTVPNGGMMDGQVPFDGTLTAQLVDVGVGRPENLAGLDLRGKLALLDDDQTCAGRMDRFRNIRRAGAAGILLWPSGPLGVCIGGPIIPEYVVSTDEDPSTTIGIPYVTLPPVEARALVKRLATEPVTITVHGTPYSSYGYQLHPVEQGRVPASMHYGLTERQLATIDTPYHSGTPGDSYADSAAFTMRQLMFFPSFLPAQPVPGTRREYVGPLDPDAITVREASTPGGGYHMSLDVFDRPVHLTRHWNAGPFTPGTVTASDSVYGLPDPKAPYGTQNVIGLCSICRQGDTLWPNFTEIGGQGQYGGSWIGGVHLYRDGTEIPAAGTGYPTFSLPKEAGDYRLTLDDRDIRTTTEWTFRSGTVTKDATQPGFACAGSVFGSKAPCRPEPVVFVSYDMTDGIALDNTVPAGRRHAFQVNVYHSPGGERMPAIAGLKLWASTDDGGRWEPVEVRRGHAGAFTASVRYPRLADTSGAVSLRAEAWDAAGNRVTQTTLRALTLR
ncbi:S8 family peptidase [Streptosporangium sp. CA-135522]|uniref:S8 family peptidase n=1 Tax=Streptosporangium sp. CA-135522 TaxID=3240072 RepID=UPI003D8FEC9F